MSIVELIPAVMAAGDDLERKKREQAKKEKVGVKKTLWDKIFSEACDREKSKDGRNGG